MEEKRNIAGEKLAFKNGKNEWAKFNAYTCIGGRSENQDALAFHMMYKTRFQVFVVCDGMGGHAGGCMASDTATTAVVKSLESQPEDTPVLEAITMAINDANTAVYTKAQDEPSLRGMGTTLTLLVIDKEAAYVTHIGDSRIYQLRNGRKVFRTFDHSMVFDQVAKGTLTEEEARVHPRGNILSKAMGVLPDVDFTITKLPYHEDDRFILCSDGVWNTRPEAELIEMFTDIESLETLVKKTWDSVEKIGRNNGGNHDNHTMIAVDMMCDSDYQESFFAKIKKLFSPKNNH